MAVASILVQRNDTRVTGNGARVLRHGVSVLRHGTHVPGQGASVPRHGAGVSGNAAAAHRTGPDDSWNRHRVRGICVRVPRFATRVPAADRPVFNPQRAFALGNREGYIRRTLQKSPLSHSRSTDDA